jgi:hypothetical protein
MGGSLGSFGTPREAYDETFDYFGKEVRVHPDLSDLALLEFAELGAGLSDASGRDAIAAVWAMLRNLVHPDDFDMFWAAARANRQTLEDLTDLCEALVEAVAERPTKRPSDSSDGQRSTGASSGDVYSLPAVQRLERQGRPDLALMVVEAVEHRASA